jgi:hypothetical protein
VRLSKAVLLGSLVLAACSSDATDSAPQLAGTYHATTLVVTPTGESAIDVLAAGGSLDIVISSTGATTGTLTIPTSIKGGMVASMAGTAAITSGTQVKLTQTADTFVRDLQWTLSSASLSVTSQTISDASFTIVLARQ